MEGCNRVRRAAMAHRHDRSQAALFVLAAFLVVTGSVGRLAAQPPQSPSAITVGTVIAERKPVAPALAFVGRVEAVNKVDIRARVTGVLREVKFKEGSVVEKDAPLFRIEPDTFEADVLSARGDLIKAQGQYAFAVAQRQRSQELVKTNAAAVATLDQRVAEEKTAQGQVVSAQAALRTAEINLGYTDITAPITGEIGRTTFTEGSLVSPESGPLATMVSVDPMYMTFPVSQREFLALQQKGKSGSGENAQVRLTFSDGSVYGHLGAINFVDVTVDRRTDTILVRATVANPDHELVDGQLVSVTVESKQPEEKVLVPQAALIADQQGAYVFIVQDGKAEVRRLKLGAEKGADVVVEQGLNGGEQVVVQGLQTLRPGAPVLAKPLPPAGQS